MKTEHILVIRFSAMGDVAMTVPVIYSLAKQYPHVRITMLSRPFARPFFENLAPNVGFMEADLKGEYKGIKGLNALYRRLVAKKFTAIADLHSVLRSNYLRMRFNLGMYKVAHIDKHRSEKNKLTASKNKQLVQLSTSFQNYADVFSRLGYPVNLDFTSIFMEGKGDISLLPSQIFTDKAGVIHSSGDKQSPWIGIAPFAAHKGKIYPIDKKSYPTTYPYLSTSSFISFRRRKRGNCHHESMGRNLSASHQCLFSTQRLSPGAQPHESTTVDDQYGQWQYALGIASEYSRHQYLGSHSSLCRLYGMEPG